jgi:RNA polymerase subunit RPABC4/transcription elongation factor Spt4
MNRSLLALLLIVVAFTAMTLSMTSCAFFPLMSGHTHIGLIPFLPFALVGFSTLLHLGLAIWVGYDANRRGMSGLLWGLLVFLTSLVGLVVYLLVAQGQGDRGASSASVAAGDEPLCPTCREPLKSDFKNCPKCGTRVACMECGRLMRGEWKVCPYCGWKKE